MAIIITGASEGIGLAIAKRFEDEGQKVIISSRSSKKLNDAIENAKLKNAVAIECDVTKEEDVKNLVSIAKKEESIDAVIFNAGLGFFKAVTDFSEEDYDKIMDTNVKGVFFGFKHFIPLLKSQNKGQFITISSMASKATFNGGNVYCASKAAVSSLAANVKMELRDTKVKSAVICPGSVETEFFAKAGAQPGKSRILTAKEVASSAFNVYAQGESSDIDEIFLRPALR